MIKNIIFDLGGVFLALDFKKTETAFFNLGVTNFNDLFTQHHASPLFTDLETGKITNETFYNNFRALNNQRNLTLTNNQIRDAWNAMLLNFPLERIEWLREIRKKYNVYLFSNTNSIHYDAFMELYEKATGKSDFNQLFISAYYSQILGLRKPDVASYVAIIEAEKLNPSETLFIDDTYKNIEGAQAAGLQTIHLVAPTTVLDLGL